MDGTTEIFKKRSGCGDVGKDYEEVNVANVVLNMVLDAKVKDFQVSSNDEAFGDFDDIVIKANNGCVKYAVQLKHSENRRRLVPKQLEEVKGDFSLVKYAKSFRQICKSQECYKYVLHTNRDCSLSDGQVIDLKEIGITVKAGNTNPEALLNTSGGNVCYKFSLDQIYIHTSVTLGEIEIYENFFKNFYLHTNQADVSKTNRDVCRKFQTFFSCSKDAYERYKKFIVEWSKEENKKEKLNKTVMRRVLVLSVLSPYIKVSFNFGEVNKKMKMLQMAIGSFGVTIVDEGGYQNIKKIFGDIKHGDLSIINKIRSRYKLNFEFVKCIDEFREDEEFSKLLWIMCKVPLIVEMNETILRAMEICQNEKFIIIANNNEFSSNYSVFKNLSSLEKNAELCNKITQEFQCSLQGKNQISLRTLVDECHELKEIITTNTLLEMSQFDVYNFEDNLETLPFPYIKRYLSTTIVDFSIFDKIDKKTLIVLNCKNRFNSIASRLTKFIVVDIESNDIKKITKQNTKKLVIIAQNECKNEDVKTALQLTKFQKFCHFELTKTGHLELLHGIDHCGDLPFKEDISISEEFLSKYKLNLIIGEPGMGKTTLLRSLKNCFSSNYLSYILYPQDISDVCKQIQQCHSPNCYEIFYNFLTDRKSVNKDFFHAMMSRNRVVVMFDALDEIWYENLETISNLIILLFEKNITQYVTCRTRLQIYLEKHLGVFSKKMRPFDDDDQNSYIQFRLSEKYPHQDHSQTIEIIKNLINYNDVLGIPLQIYMLTELFRENKEKYSKFTSQSFNITDLYRYFVEEKFNFCYNKFATGIDLQKIVFDQEMRTKIFRYQEAALKLLIPTILVNKIECYEFLQDVKNNGDPMGVLVSVSHNDVPNFFHLAFAEYFVALYFLKRHREIPNFENILFEDGRKNIKLYFDLLLAPNHPAHVAILYKNIEVLEGYDDDIKRQSDLGGRNLMHLAASSGYSYPEFEVEYDEEENCYSIKPSRHSVKNENFKYCETLFYLTKICDLEQRDEILNWTPVSYAQRSNALLEKTIILRHLREKYSTLNDDLKMASFLYFSARFGYDHVFEIYECFPKVRIEERFRFSNSTLLDKAATSKFGVLYAFKLLATEVYRVNKNMPKWLWMIGEQFENIDKEKRQLLGYNFNKLYRKLVEILKTSTVDVNVVDSEKRSPIHWACVDGQTKLVELLIELNAALNIGDNSGLTPLMIACEYRHEDIVKLLLESEVDANIGDNIGKTALHWASYSGSEEIIKLLLDADVDKNCRDVDGRTALHWGCYGGHRNGVKLLLQSGMSLNDRDKYGKAPLHLGCYSVPDVVRILLEHVDSISVSDNRGRTPLHIACKRKHGELLKLLLEFSTDDVNVTDKNGKTPLHWACQKKQYYFVKLLLKCDVDVNVRTRAGKTPLYIACEKNMLNIVKFLLERGAYPNISDNDGQAPLHIACKMNAYAIVKVLLQFRANVNVRNGREQTPLYVACGWLNLAGDLVELLLEYEADPNLCDVDGQTPLHKMCEAAISAAVVKLLLESNANVNVRNKYGRTPLHVACRDGNRDIAELLLDWKADANIVDQNNRTPVDWGCKWGKWWMRRLFEQSST